MILTTQNIKMKIAIQGYEGSFHHLAAINYYGQPVDVLPMSTFKKVVKAIEKETATEGMMAIENSIAGSILPNYNLLQSSSLSVTGEIYLSIGQHLMALPGQTLEDIKEVHSHPMAILQCDKFFSKHPEIKLIESEDTALSARTIRENNLKGVGAIAGKMAAEIYELPILKENIETVKNNFTRFLILSRHPDNPSVEANKASLYFKVPHQPGALVNALAKVSETGANLSKIQSFPIVEKEWEYYFHLDIEFENLQQYHGLIDGLSASTEELKVLGVYKKGKTL